MSAADESSGHLSSSLDQQVPEDRVDPIFPPTEVQENAASSKPVYLASHLPQDVVPAVEIPSRKHEVPSSELELPSSELELETSAKPFMTGSEQRHVPYENKTLPPHANPEVEKGIRESRKIHLQRNKKVTSYGNSLTKQMSSPRRSLSEGSTQHNSLEKENNSSQQASDDGYVYISPFVVQELKEHLRQLEERVANVAGEKKKFEGLYISEKQKREEVELKSSKYVQEVAKLRNIVYKLDKFGKHADLTADEESLVRSIRAEQGIDLSYLPGDLFTLFNSPLQL